MLPRSPADRGAPAEGGRPSGRPGIQQSAGPLGLQRRPAGPLCSPRQAAAPAEEAEEKTEFTVMLDEVPADKKIAVLKVVRGLTGLGLKEAKELVESAPKEVQAGISKDAAEDAKKQIEAAGGKVLSSLSACKLLDPAKTIVLTSDPSTPSQLREPGVRNILKLGGKTVPTSWLFHVIITQCINPVIELD